MKPQITASIFLSILALFSYLEDFTIGVILCELLLSLYIVFADYSKGIRNWNFITYYSLFSVLYIIGNFMVAYSIDSPLQFEYDFYLSKPHLVDAAMISYIGHLALLLGYLVSGSNNIKFTLSGIIPDSILKPAIIISIIYNLQFFITGLEIQIIDFFSYPILFIFIKSAVRNKKSEWINYGILLVVLIALKGILFSYRRQAAFEPFFIFFIALIMSHGNNWRKIISPKYIILVVCFILLISQFNTMGKVRGYRGQERIDQWTNISKFETKDNNDLLPIDTEQIEQTPLARASTLNQLSQVVKLQSENGYYNGSTISYIAFAFIPRFLWPEKPLIMQGRWFALATGLAYNHGDSNSLTGVNNSINMTVAGELFLNFGFIGVAIGMMLIGYLLKVCWNLCNIYDLRNNLTSSIFGIFLLIVAYFYLQVDLQFLVTLAQVFLTVLFINYLMTNFINIKQSNRVFPN